MSFPAWEIILLETDVSFEFSPLTFKGWGITWSRWWNLILFFFSLVFFPPNTSNLSSTTGTRRNPTQKGHNEPNLRSGFGEGIIPQNSHRTSACRLVLLFVVPFAMAMFVPFALIMS